MGQSVSFLSHLKSSGDFDASLGIFDKLIKSFGFDSYLFTLMNVQSSPSIFRMKYFTGTFPKEWQEIYLSENYIFKDPVAAGVMSNDSPFYWSDYISTQKLSDAQASMMKHAQQYDLVDGIGCSYLRNRGNLFTLSLSTKQLITNYDTSVLAQIYLAGSYLTKSYEENFEAIANRVTLSDQEDKIISLAAIGKTDNEIAQLIDLSVNTVRYHWKNIFAKLESYSRIFAIIRAINLNLIDIDVFEVTTEDGSVRSYRK